ncbi:MAG: hypothetical protein HKN27_04435 [Silicimonas sp.]|nr:hypothetical protein [Silicimonas sp.]
MIFSRAPFVSDDMQSWIADCFDWFDARFRPPAKPILPTTTFFTAPGGKDEATARLVLKDVCRLLEFEHPIELVPLDRPSAEYRLDYQALSEVAGTYQETEDGRIISYDPEQMHHPLRFINTMAHEVMHARLSGLQDQVPGGYEAHELATDLGCIIAGFGVFQLQAADDAGWSGYLTQPSRAYALAYFLRDRGLGIDTVAAHLSPRTQKLLKRGFRAVQG